MGRAYLSLGSNIEPARHLRAAIVALRERFGAVRVSPVYCTPAIGFDGLSIFMFSSINAFVLKPLADLAPDYVHPAIGRSLAALWAGSGLAIGPAIELASTNA